MPSTRSAFLEVRASTSILYFAKLKKSVDIAVKLLYNKYNILCDCYITDAQFVVLHNGGGVFPLFLFILNKKVKTYIPKHAAMAAVAALLNRILL